MAHRLTNPAACPRCTRPITAAAEPAGCDLFLCAGCTTVLTTTADGGWRLLTADEAAALTPAELHAVARTQAAMRQRIRQLARSN